MTNDEPFKQWVKDRPFAFLWIASLVLTVLALPCAALMDGGCALPFLAVGLIGSTFGGLFAFFEWTID